MTDSWPPGGLDVELEALQEQYLPSKDRYDIAGLLNDERLGRTAVVSSFGAESVILLHYVSRIRPDLEVLFLDTGKHFEETILYRDRLVAELGLNLRILRPRDADLMAEDPQGGLHVREPDACCRIRKVYPLQDALEGFDTWVSGQKRFQASTRAGIGVIERDGVRKKVNPLALWSKEELEDYRKLHKLPPHPLEAQGYPSIGCAPCTRAVKPGEDSRAGRWSDVPDKAECGIHLGPDGRFHRTGSSS